MEELIAELIKVDGIQKVLEDVDFRPFDEETLETEEDPIMEAAENEHHAFYTLSSSIASAKKHFCLFTYAIVKKERQIHRDNLVYSLVRYRDTMQCRVKKWPLRFLELITAMQFKEIDYRLKLDDLRFMRQLTQQFAKYIFKYDQEMESRHFTRQLTYPFRGHCKQYDKCIKEFYNSPQSVDRVAQLFLQRKKIEKEDPEADLSEEEGKSNNGESFLDSL